MSPPLGDATAAERAFRSYNRRRRARLEEQIGERAARALGALPVLLHVNQPGLPGYVEEAGCPFGISDYSPSKRELEGARALFPQAHLRRTGILRPAIDLLAVMGSAGTMGFSEESDLDVWVCRAAGIRPHQAGALHAKVRAVEQWLNENTDHEIHLFLQATEQIRTDDFGETDLEGCGSAMGTLLKEEFYRASVLLAGKPPLWWLVPPGASPEAYRRHVAELQADPSFSGDAYVDLGAVARVPVGEFFGAAIWQIAKGWKSPFKSALKMGLLEKVVRTGDRVLPVCETLKERVLAGECPDPYALLFDEVLTHYRENGDAATEDLLARCFYLKTGVRLDPEDLDHQHGGSPDDLSRYVRSWGWGPRKVRHLNNLDRWKFEWVQAMALEVDRYFLRTYKRIRAALEDSGEAQRITPRDLTILGRKLQAMYRQGSDKVEHVHFMTSGVSEPLLSLYQETLPDGETPWRLYRGQVTPYNVDEQEGNHLRTSADLLELLVWAAQNRILTGQTRLTCRGVEREVPAPDLESLAASLVGFTQDAAVHEPPVSALLENPRPTRMLVIPNLGLDAEGLREVGALTVSSWGETFYRSWTGGAAFRTFLEEALIPFLLEAAPPRVLCVHTSPRKVGRRTGAAHALERDLPDVASFLGEGGPEGVKRRWLGTVDDEGFYVLERAGEEARCRAFPTADSLLRYLSGVGPHRRVETRVQNHSGTLAVLGAMTSTASEGLIDIYLLREPDRQTLFVVDEIGNLIHTTSEPQDRPYALSKLLLFLESAVRELAGQPESPLKGRTLAEVVRIHTLHDQGMCRATPATREYLGQVKALGLNPMGLTIERTEDGDGGGYRITWGDQIIRSGEVEQPLEEVRKRILRARRSGLDYDPFVTRLFLDERFKAEHCGAFVTTGHHLFYRKAIEQRLSG